MTFSNNATPDDPGWFTPVATAAHPGFGTTSQENCSDVGVVIIDAARSAAGPARRCRAQACSTAWLRRTG